LSSRTLIKKITIDLNLTKIKFRGSKIIPLQ